MPLSDLPNYTTNYLDPTLAAQFGAYTPEYQQALFERLRPDLVRRMREAYMGAGRMYSGEAASAEGLGLAQLQRDLALQGSEAQRQERLLEENRDYEREQQKEQLRGQLASTGLETGGNVAGMYLMYKMLGGAGAGGGAKTGMGLSGLVPAGVRQGFGGMSSPFAGIQTSGTGALGYNIGSAANLGLAGLGGYGGYKAGGKIFGPGRTGAERTGGKVGAGVGGAAGYYFGGPLGATVGSTLGRGVGKYAARGLSGIGKKFKKIF